MTNRRVCSEMTAASRCGSPHGFTRSCVLLTTLAAGGLWSSWVAAEAPSFSILNAGHASTNGTALSADGSTVVGHVITGNPAQSFLWTEKDGFVLLPNLPGGSGGGAVAVSSNGAVIVGNASVPDGTEAFRWTAGDGMVGLGDMPGGQYMSQGLGVSGNGDIVVGFAWSTGNCGLVPYRWTQATGMVSLGTLTANACGAARGISPDGEVIVGTSGVQAFRWTQPSGMVGLGQLPGGSSSVARAVSANGAVIVGMADTPDGSRAMRWHSSTGMVGLGLLPGALDSDATAVSGNGSIVVGRCIYEKGTVAFIWDSAHGMQLLQDVLVNEFGLNLEDWTLLDANGISTNGLSIVGRARNSTNQIHTYLVRLPGVVVPGDVTGDGQVNVSDLLAIINQWGLCPAPPSSCPADVAPQPNGDGQVNVSDLLMVINNWG